MWYVNAAAPRRVPPAPPVTETRVSTGFPGHPAGYLAAGAEQLSPGALPPA